MVDYLISIQKSLGRLFAEISRARNEAKIGNVVGRGASGDITHRIDALAEESLIDSFRKDIPGCTVVSEEAGVLEGRDGAPIVLMDPIDGSTNAVRGLPVFCGTVGILEGRTFRSMKVAGVVDLVSGEIIVGDKSGVFVNGSRQRPSSVFELSEALISYELKVRVERPKEIMDKINSLIARTKYPRVLGSAALEIAYVAIGRIDAYVSPGKQLRNYDCLPSIFLVKAGGGFVHGVGQDLDSIDVTSGERVSFVVAGNDRLGRDIAAKFPYAKL